MPAPVEVTRLSQAIEQFKNRAPVDLPPNVMEGLDQIEGMLKEYAPSGESSPGREAVAEVAGGTPGTGVHFSKAAKGPDQPSPGQREAMEASRKIQEAAESLREHIG